MATAAPSIDLDAAKREASFPEGIPLTFNGEQFVLPAELPTEVLDPILSPDLDLVGVVVSVFEREEQQREIASRTGEDMPDSSTTYTEGILAALSSRPLFIRQTFEAFKGCYRVLFGDEQFERFEAGRPSFNDYIRLTRSLVPLYGVTLGEAFASPGSSESDGATPKLTSSATPESTSEAPSPARQRKAS